MKFTDEQMLASMRRVFAENNGDTSVRTYAAQRKGSDPAWRTIAYRFATWDKAVSAAKGGDVPLAHAKTDPPPPPAQHAAFVRAMAGESARSASNDSAPPSPHESRTIAIVSDIHFDLHDEATWYAFREWHAYVRPKHTVILGDFVDLGMLGRHEQGPDEPVFAIPQIQMFVREANELLKECDVLTIAMGNHDERWTRALGMMKPHAFRGAIGLSLREQAEFQGLEKSNRVRWFEESNETPALMVADFALHHGHNKGGKWGCADHMGAKLLRDGNGQSQIIGHTHRAQLYVRAAFGKRSYGILNPAMCRPMTYAKDPNWVRGWTVLNMMAPDYGHAEPEILVADQGRVAWGGKTFGVRTRVAA